MQPELFVVGQHVHAWGLMLGIALAMAMWTAGARLATIGEDPKLIFHIGAVSMIGGVLGSRIWSLFQVGWHSTEMISFGGYVFGALAVVVFLRLHRRPILRTMDALFPAVPVGAAFGRLGCFLNGCCYGAPAELPWSIRPPGLMSGPDGDVLAVPMQQFVKAVELGHAGTQQMLAERAFGGLHPTQLYSSLAMFAVFLVLDRLWLPRKRFHGEIGLALMLLYGVARFLLEIPRIDTPIGPEGLAPGQRQALVLVVVSLPLLVYNRARGAP